MVATPVTGQTRIRPAEISHPAEFVMHRELTRARRLMRRHTESRSVTRNTARVNASVAPIVITTRRDCRNEGRLVHRAAWSIFRLETKPARLVTTDDDRSAAIWISKPVVAVTRGRVSEWGIDACSRWLADARKDLTAKDAKENRQRNAKVSFSQRTL